MTDTTVLARIAALRRMPTAELKAQWTLLFDAPPPPHNRRFLESRLIYRIQELAYGGLAPETVKRLERIGEDRDGGSPSLRRARGDDRPVAGTLLIREHQDVDPIVTVLTDGLAWQGRPYQSLSAIARASAPQACFSRRTSRTWRISNLPAGIGPLPRCVEGRPWPVLSIADDGSGNPQRVAALPRNRWPLCVGISGRLPSESLAALRRNTQAASFFRL